MNLTCILVDCETVKPAAAELKLIRDAGYRVRIFHGPHQNRFDADIVQVSNRDRLSWKKGGQNYFPLAAAELDENRIGLVACMFRSRRSGPGPWRLEPLSECSFAERADAGFDPGNCDSRFRTDYRAHFPSGRVM